MNKIQKTVETEHIMKESLVKLKDKCIKELIRDEVKLANLVHKPFINKHEGYAVLKEEIEEARDEQIKIIKGLDNLWTDIKADSEEKILEIQIDNIKEKTVKAIKELIQVGAMCKKFQIYLEGGEETKGCECCTEPIIGIFIHEGEEGCKLAMNNIGTKFCPKCGRQLGEEKDGE